MTKENITPFPKTHNQEPEPADPDLKWLPNYEHDFAMCAKVYEFGWEEKDWCWETTKFKTFGWLRWCRYMRNRDMAEYHQKLIDERCKEIVTLRDVQTEDSVMKIGRDA
jgi:hypothetical protein